MPPKFVGAEQGGQVLKKIKFTSFLGPGQYAESSVATTQGAPVGKYKHIRSKWTRELMEYKDEMERKEMEKEEHAAAQRQAQRLAAARLRAKEKSMQVPMIEPPVEATSLISPHRLEGISTSFSSIPIVEEDLIQSVGRRGTMKRGSEGPAIRRASSVPPRILESSGTSSMSNSKSRNPLAKSLASGLVSKFHAELFPEAVEKYNQLLCLASHMETQKRRAKIYEKEEAREKERWKDEEKLLHTIHQKRGKVLAQRDERVKVLHDESEVRMKKVLRKRIDREEELAKQESALIEKMRQVAGRLANTVTHVEGQPSKVFESLRQNEERRMQLEEEEKARRDEIEKRMMEREARCEERREFLKEQQREWQAEKQAWWEQTVVTADRKREEKRLATLADIQGASASRAERSAMQQREAKERNDAKAEKLRAHAIKVQHIQERFAEEEEAKIQDGLRALAEKRQRMDAKMQEMADEWQAKLNDLHRQELEQQRVLARNQAAYDKQRAELFQNDAERLQRSEEHLRLVQAHKAEHIRAWNESKTSRKQQVIDAHQQWAAEFIAAKEAREKRHQEHLKEVATEAERDAARATKPTWGDKYAKMMARIKEHQAAELMETMNAIKRHEEQMQKVQQARQKEAEEGLARMRANYEVQLQRALSIVDQREEARLKVEHEVLVERAQAGEEALVRRQESLARLADAARAKRIEKEPLEERATKEIEQRRLEFEQRQAEREKTKQAVLQELEEAKQKRLEEVHKLQAKNWERHEEQMDKFLDSMETLMRTETAKAERWARRKQEQADERARRGVDLQRIRSQRKQRAQDLLQESINETELSWSVKPQQRIERWFLGPGELSGSF
uniref:Uncharacterized protein n=2 Tax=Eutreptiella gymnastica TaxID=73025 RepID=A0A7S1J198_9EUGL|mmetsp:Transcript_58260/g.103952  ORF Transcript_58260/g.103952 Transcript_58260/m.103952 type:complete len:852 (+) Transcript_58260:106-2661(+)